MNRVVFAGQNKYFGTVEEATEFWLSLGINHIMIKQEEDIRLIGNDNKVIISDFIKLSKLQREYGVKYHLHIYDLRFNDDGTSSFEDAQPRMDKILIDCDHLVQLDKMIEEFDLYPLITIHLARFGKWLGHDLEIDEKEALEKNIEFLQNLKLHSKLSLETMHDPDRNPGHVLLGYKAEHFENVLNGKIDLDQGLCFDTGYSKMIDGYSGDFLEFNINSMHLEGTDGTKDQHFLPTKDNVGDFEVVRKAIKKCEGPVVFEIGDHNYSREEIGECVEFWRETIN